MDVFTCFNIAFFSRLTVAAQDFEKDNLYIHMFTDLPKSMFFKFCLYFFQKNMHSYFLYRKSYVDLFMDLLKSMLFCLQILHNVCDPVLFTDLQKCIIFLHSFLKVLNLLIDLAKKYMFMFCL